MITFNSCVRILRIINFELLLHAKTVRRQIKWLKQTERYLIELSILKSQSSSNIRKVLSMVLMSPA